MHAPEVTCSIVAFVISLSRLARFAVCKERLVRRSVDGDPDLSRLFVDTVGMTSQLMLTTEAVGIVSAYRTLQS